VDTHRPSEYTTFRFGVSLWKDKTLNALEVAGHPNLGNQLPPNELQYNMSLIIYSIGIEPCSYYDPCGHLGCPCCGLSVVPSVRSSSVGILPHPLSVEGWGSISTSVLTPEFPVVIAHDSLRASQSHSPLLGAANYGEAVKMVESEFTTPSGGQGTHVRVPVRLGGVPYLRNVIESKRNWRACARRRNKNRFPLPASAGCELGADIPVKAPSKSSNRFQPLADDEEDCRFAARLVGKAKALVSFLSEDQGLEGDVGLLPPYISCGHLRSAVRGCFPLGLTPLAELSVKTAQKAERSCCKVCKPTFDRKLSEWKEALKKPVTIDNEHLERFKRALRANVPDRWNDIPGPYIPNGSATLRNGVKQGGNWNEEEFSDRCRATLVFSSGKPRVVTCYSSYNTEVLTPLHESLYSKIGRLGWLLVGDPTTDRVAGLNGDGVFLSFDYVGATDSIKSAYTKAAIEVLIDCGEGLSEEEVRCLRVLGDLKLWDLDYALFEAGLGFLVEDELSALVDGFSPEDYEGFSRGQPMGSAMSFPLLCLVNKTVVDLALTDLLTSKKISFNEWTSHRCLINGDDLLLREPRLNTDLRSAIVRNGAAVGLVVNEEKSMVSESLAEINSTLFSEKGCVQEKKTNANALYMKPDVSDVLGLAREATVTSKAFVRVVRANARLLARQEDKLLWKLPYPFQMLCWKDRKIRKALSKQPDQRRPVIANIFPVVPIPDGYDLDREEEVAILRERVKEVRSSGKEIAAAKKATRRSFRTTVSKVECNFHSLTKKKKPGCETILSVLAQAFMAKKKRELAEEEALAASLEGKLEWDCDPDSCLALTYPNKISFLIDAVKGFEERILTAKPCEFTLAFDFPKSTWSLTDHVEMEVRRSLDKYG